MSKAVGFLTGQASMAFEMLSTAWKALKKKIVAESFFFIMHGQLLPNLMVFYLISTFFCSNSLHCFGYKTHLKHS